MSGRRSRSKGQRGEREWAALLVEHGFTATRNRIGAATDDIIHNVLGVSFEVKRAETLQFSQWWRQAVEQALPDRVPVLAFRSNGEPWRVVLPAEHYLRLEQLRSNRVDE